MTPVTSPYETRIPIITRLRQHARECLVKLAAEEISTNKKLSDDPEFMTGDGLYKIAEETVSNFANNAAVDAAWTKSMEDAVHKNKDNSFKRSQSLQSVIA